MRREAGRVAAARSAQRGGVTGSASPESRSAGTSMRGASWKAGSSGARGHSAQRPRKASRAPLPRKVGARAGGRIGEEGDVLGAEHRELQRPRHAGLDVGDRQDPLRGERGEVALPGLAEEGREERGGLRRVEEGERHLPDARRRPR